MYQVSLSAPSFLSPSHSTQSTTPYSLEQALIILLPSPGLAWPLQSLLLLISSPVPPCVTTSPQNWPENLCAVLYCTVHSARTILNQDQDQTKTIDLSSEE